MHLTFNSLEHDPLTVISGKDDGGAAPYSIFKKGLKLIPKELALK